MGEKGREKVLKEKGGGDYAGGGRGDKFCLTLWCGRFCGFGPRKAQKWSKPSGPPIMDNIKSPVL